nr:trigger factor family protein [Parafrankia sp. CH37]
MRVSGFRPGKVPPRILDQRLGRGVILDEAIQEALPRLYSEAVQAEEVDVLSRPEVDITEFADGAQLVFTARWMSVRM